VEQRQAHAHAAWLNLEHPDREHFEWVAMGQAPGRWAVVRMARKPAIDPALIAAAESTRARRSGPSSLHRRDA
jgi:hypothetical protein